jgi:signal transduction histidine kinase
MAQARTPTQRGSPTRFWPVALVLVLGLGLTLIVVGVLRDAAYRHDHERFEALTGNMMEMVDTRFELFAQALTGLRDLFALRETVDDRLWLNYIAAMFPEVHLKGLHELGFAERVLAPNEQVTQYLLTNLAFATPYLQPGLEEHLSRMCAAHGTNYSIGPIEPDFCPYAFPVTRCWRAAGAKEAARQRLGTNIYNRLDADEAMPWTIGTLLPAATRAIDIQTPEGKRRGVSLFLTVTRPDMPAEREKKATQRPPSELTAMAERNWWLQFRRQERYCKGVVYFTVEIDSFLRSTLGNRTNEIGFVLYQGTNRISAERLHGTTSAEYAAKAGSPYLTRSGRLLFYGKKLTFDFYTLPAFERQSLRVWPRVAGAVGTVLTLLVAWGVGSSTRARLRQEAIAVDLRESRDRLQAALLDRDRLNRDLHDTVIQSIYATGLGLQSARRALGKDPDRASGRITELMAELNAIIVRLRGYIHGQPVLPVGTLAAQLEETLASFRRETEAAIALHVEPAVEEHLVPSVSIHVANIVREAVSNSVRHGQSTAIQIRVGGDASELRLEIEDNCGGFDLAAEPGSGCGLNNIRARAVEMGGTVQFSSVTGCGTIIRVTVPFQADKPIHQMA